jgi:hypothetical protein
MCQRVLGNLQRQIQEGFPVNEQRSYIFARPLKKSKFCGEPAISLHSHHVSQVQWTTRLLPVTRDPGFNPLGGTYVKPGFSC